MAKYWQFDMCHPNTISLVNLQVIVRITMSILNVLLNPCMPIKMVTNMNYKRAAVAFHFNATFQQALF